MHSCTKALGGARGGGMCTSTYGVYVHVCTSAWQGNSVYLCVCSGHAYLHCAPAQ